MIDILLRISHLLKFLLREEKNPSLGKTFHNAAIFMKATVFIFQNKPRRLVHWSPPCFLAIADPVLLTPRSSFPLVVTAAHNHSKDWDTKIKTWLCLPRPRKDNRRMTATTDIPKQDLDHGDGCHQSPHLLRNTDEVQQEWEAGRGEPCSLSNAEMNQLPIPG